MKNIKNAKFAGKNPKWGRKDTGIFLIFCFYLFLLTYIIRENKRKVTNNEKDRKLEPEPEVSSVSEGPFVQDEVVESIRSKGYFSGVITGFIYLALSLQMMGPFCNDHNQKKTQVISGGQYQTNVDQYRKNQMDDTKDYIYRGV